MARSFREAEEASNAQGIPQATVNWALQNAAKNPTPENIAIAKDTYAAQQALNPAPNYAEIVSNYNTAVAQIATDMPQIKEDIASTIADVRSNVGDINTILTEIAGITGKPADLITPPSGGNIDALTQLQRDQAAAARKDAFKLLEDVFSQYGLQELVPSIRSLMTNNNIGPNEAALLLKTDPAYNAPYLKRFAGNTERVKKGLNALSEADYINLEDQYSTAMKAYGVSNLATRDEMASLIANDISQVELKRRLDLAVTQVKNADPNITKMLRQYYPGITDTDLTSYFLNPEKTLPDLQKKVTSAEIGAAALEQGAQYGIQGTRAEELATMGVTQETARTGFQKVATVLPESKKLSDIYGEANINYTQGTAEDEFLGGSASAARKRKQLAQLESASFSGQSGVERGTSLNKNLQGKF